MGSYGSITNNLAGGSSGSSSSSTGSGNTDGGSLETTIIVVATITGVMALMLGIIWWRGPRQQLPVSTINAETPRTPATSAGGQREPLLTGQSPSDAAAAPAQESRPPSEVVVPVVAESVPGTRPPSASIPIPGAQGPRV